VSEEASNLAIFSDAKEVIIGLVKAAIRDHAAEMRELEETMAKLRSFGFNPRVLPNRLFAKSRLFRASPSGSGRRTSVRFKFGKGA
jgi:hypothetical protein